MKGWTPLAWGIVNSLAVTKAPRVSTHLLSERPLHLMVLYLAILTWFSIPSSLISWTDSVAKGAHLIIVTWVIHIIRYEIK